MKLEEGVQTQILHFTPSLFVMDLHKALKMLLCYPEGHPIRQSQIDQLMAMVVRAPSAGQVVFTVRGDKLFSPPHSLPIAANFASVGLLRYLSTHRIDRMTFTASVTASDLEHFLCALLLPPEQLAPLGGVAGFLSAKGIRSIAVTHCDVEHDSAVDPLAAEPAAGGEQCHEVPDDLAMLLRDLASTPPGAPFQARCSSITRALYLLRHGGSQERLMDAMLVFSGQVNESGREDLHRYARQTLAELADDRLCAALVWQLEMRPPRGREELLYLFSLLGSVALPVVIQRLCAADSLTVRRAMLTVLVRIGQPAIPALLPLLRDERWYVVRNGIYLLATIAGNAALPHLAVSLSHHDARVRKELVRALIQLGGEEAGDLLLTLGRDTVVTVRVEALRGLGALRHRSGLGLLLEILSIPEMKRGSRTLKLESLRAIGMLGDARALATLHSLVQKRPLLIRKRWEELQLAILDALVKIGHSGSIPVLQGMRPRTRELRYARDAALSALQSRAATS